MSQAIKLPTDITKGLPFNDTFIKEMDKVIQDYATELAMIAIILSDNYMKELYEKSQSGYIACIDQLQAWATEFVAKYAYIEEWEEFCSTQTIYKNIMCWEDFVIAYGADKMSKI